MYIDFSLASGNETWKWKTSICRCYFSDTIFQLATVDHTGGYRSHSQPRYDYDPLWSIKYPAYVLLSSIIIYYHSPILPLSTNDWALLSDDDSWAMIFDIP